MKSISSLLIIFALAMLPGSTLFAFPVAQLKAPGLPVEKAHFFENSVRGDIPAGEGRFLVALTYDAAATITDYETKNNVKLPQETKDAVMKSDGTASCSAFFLENKDHRNVIGTARHCVMFKEQEACAKGFKLKSYATGHAGKCLAVLIDDTNTDMFVFEAGFEGHDDEYEHVDHLKPLVIFPGGTEELEVYGYPGDDERNSRPTKTWNCHLFNATADPEYKNFYANFLNDESKIDDQKWVGDVGPEFMAAYNESWKHEMLLRHNCSIYGGNSGGPMVLKGTNLLVGLPESYNTTKQVFPADTYGILISPIVIWNDNSKDFQDALGIQAEVRYAPEYTTPPPTQEEVTTADNAERNALVHKVSAPSTSSKKAANSRPKSKKH